MKDSMQRVGVGIGVAVIVVHYFPFSAATVIVFFLGVVCTVVFELVVVLKYLDKKSPDVEEVFLVTNKPPPEEPLPQTRIYIPQKLSLDIKPCYCSSSEFMSLVTGKDQYVKKLVSLAEGFISAERLFGQHLTRLGESSLLDKIKMKGGLFASGSPWSKLKVLLNQFGEKRILESESLQTGTCRYLLEVRKKVKSQLKDLREAQLSEGQRFTAVAARVKKLSDKLAQAKQGEHAALTEYDSSKNNLAAFSTLIKQEMKIKVAKNEAMMLTAKIKEAQDELEHEASEYLEKINPLVGQISDINTTKTDAAKVVIQAWVEALQHLFTWENFSWGKVADEVEGSATPHSEKPRKDGDLKSNITSWITKKLNIQEQTEQLFFIRDQESDFKKVMSSWGDLHSFVTGLCDALDFYARELGRLAQFEASMYELGLAESWSRLTAFLTQIAMVTEESAKDLREVLLSTSQTTKCGEKFAVLLSRAKDDSGSAMNSVLQTELANLEEIQQKESVGVRTVLLKVMSAALNTSCEVLAGLEKEVTNTTPAQLVFEKGEIVHHEQCPQFRVEVEVGMDGAAPYEAGRSIGEPESALWFNSLFSTFMREWSESQRFLAYLCRRLKKVYNKDRPHFLGEISVPKVILEGKSPEINRIVPLECEPGNFLHECDIWYKGALEFYLEFEAHWTVASVQVAVKVVLRSIYGRVRVFFCPSAMGKSWYSFIAEPAYQVLIQPVLGRQNKFELNRFPQLNSVLTSVLAKKLRKFVWPNRRSVKIPLSRTSEVKMR